MNDSIRLIETRDTGIKLIEFEIADIILYYHVKYVEFSPLKLPSIRIEVSGALTVDREVSNTSE